MARNILDVFKYLDKNGLQKLISLIKRGSQEHWIGTQAEYNAQAANIPAGTIVALTDDEDTDYDHGKYALVETVTGKRWIDGKPIYRKVFVVTNSATTAHSESIPLGFTDIDTVVSLTGTMKSKGSNQGITRSLPFCYYGSLDWSVGLTVLDNTASSDKNTVYIQVGVSAAATADKYIITLEYTKTGDW